MVGGMRNCGEFTWSASSRNRKASLQDSSSSIVHETAIWSQHPVRNLSCATFSYCAFSWQCFLYRKMVQPFFLQSAKKRWVGTSFTAPNVISEKIWIPNTKKKRTLLSNLEGTWQKYGCSELASSVGSYTRLMTPVVTSTWRISEAS